MESVSEIRKAIEENVRQFYIGFGGDFLFAKEFGTPEEIETAIIKIYKSNAEELIKSFKLSVKELDSLRSKYIPWEIRNNIIKYSENQGMFSNAAIIAENKFFYESYENAFMRALGMPMSDIFEKSGYNFKHRFNAFEGFADSNDLLLLDRILLERENIDIRSKAVSKNYFNLDATFSKSNLKENLNLDQQTAFSNIENKYLQKVKELDTSTSIEENGPNTNISAIKSEFVLEVKKANIKVPDKEIGIYFDVNISGKNISSKLIDVFQDINVFSYMLFPPVQNSSISKCISDPSSLVTEPFKSVNSRIVNLSKSKKSLLETILNIRLDKVTGLNYEKVVGVLIDKKIYKSNNEEQFEDEIKYNDFIGSRSIIESIIINRLFKSLSASAFKLAKDVENYIKAAAENKISLDSLKVTPGNGKAETPSEEPDSKKSDLDVDDLIVLRRSLNSYEMIKNINDSILFLLSEKEDISSLGAGELKSSGIREGALFDSIVAAVGFPGKKIDEKISEINNSINRSSANKIGIRNYADNIDEAMGLYRGVGVLDILIFSLGMFLVDENILIGMIPIEGYNNLKKNKGLPKSFFSAFESSPIVSTSGNNWSLVQAKSLEEYSKVLAELYNYLSNKEFLKE